MFKSLRHKLYEALILTLPEDVDEFLVYCDALIMGLGGANPESSHDYVRFETFEAS